MIINPDHRGRTAGGRTTYRALVTYEPDDYHPDSKYWQLRAHDVQVQLADLLGSSDYRAWADLVWPGATIEEFSWRTIYQQTNAALGAALLGERDLQNLCGIAWHSQHSTTQEAA